jgi:oxygen-independent coproporphyrinogen-3 oxidase
MPLSKPASAPERPLFGVYVHWPFCLAKCPYCDFNSHVRSAIDQDRWRAALVAELRHAAALAGERRVTSVFFGGGTPSLMPAATVAAMIDEVARLWPLAHDIEITLEANPTSVEAERFRDYRAAGVNRVSIGVQSLDDTALAFLGRQHSAAEARAALTLGAATFERLSFDLIYARPGQTESVWLAELDGALDLAAGHLSLYQLTLEPGTPFHAAWRAGRLQAVEPDLAATLYEATEARCADAGLVAYEVSNYALAGHESRHNLAYWRYHDYAGVGPGAHGRLTVDGDRLATHQLRAPEAWLAAVEASGHGTEAAETLTPAEQRTEALLMGLRLKQGIDRADFAARLGAPLDDTVDRPALGRLVAGGFLLDDGASLRATAAGRLVLNQLLVELVA